MAPSWRDRVRAAVQRSQPYTVVARPGAVKLDANESPFPLSREAMAEVARAVGTLALNRYPDPVAAALKAALAARLSVGVDQLLVGNGSDELIGLLCAAFGEPRGRRAAASVLYPAPSFVVYRTEAIAHGLTPKEVPLGAGFAPDEAALLQAVARESPNLLFLATPNNPTGTEWPRATVARLLVQHPDVVTVVDEAYLAYAGARSCADLALAHPQCLVLGTLSKMGLAGLRVGYLIGRAEVLAEVEKVRPPYNLSSPDQAAAIVLLEHHRAELDANVAAVRRERERLHAALGALPGLEVFPSGANFLLARVTDGKGSRELAERLLERGVVVRAFDGAGPLAGCLRITVGTEEENSWLLDALPRCLP
jgi:histidinol-phosphate aminotransferase